MERISITEFLRNYTRYIPLPKEGLVITRVMGKNKFAKPEDWALLIPCPADIELAKSAYRFEKRVEKGEIPKAEAIPYEDYNTFEEFFVKDNKDFFPEEKREEVGEI